MRVSEGNEHLRVKAIAGTHVVLMALDMDEATRAGLRGFAIKRGVKGRPQTWLRGIKYFKDLIPDPKPEDDYSSRDQPFQTFLWSDYQARPGTEYDFTIVALYGDLHALEERHTLTFSITTEPEYDQKHGVWFNRGAIASHAFETKFHNKQLTQEMTDNVSDDGKLLDPETEWLSRGLAEACLKYINDTKPKESLRVCAYEFTYLPVLRALKRALDRGVDLQIVYHDTKKEKDANRAAIGEAGLPQTITRKGKKIQVLHVRTRTQIPHNKFIVKLVNDVPTQVWTGSTNFTDTGFFGQTNVGHLVTDKDTATTYLKYWTELAEDPPHSQALKNAIDLTANPANAIAKSSLSAFFSPRIADNMLDWYGQRIADTATLAMMTIPFNVARTILAGLGQKRDAMRLVILEDVPTSEVSEAEKRNRGKLAFSNGAILGKSFIKYKTSFGGAQVTPIPNSDLDQWFVDEELARPTNNGHVFFVHSKVLLIDPLSDDPLICSGSANFSTNSLTANDENMLLIRGDKRVADIYLTELDRIFRHFRSRDIINHNAATGKGMEWLRLDPTDVWIGPNFKEGNYKNNRRLLFFPKDNTAKPWSALAAHDPRSVCRRRPACCKGPLRQELKSQGAKGSRRKEGRSEGLAEESEDRKARSGQESGHQNGAFEAKKQARFQQQAKGPFNRETQEVKSREEAGGL